MHRGSEYCSSSLSFPSRWRFEFELVRFVLSRPSLLFLSHSHPGVPPSTKLAKVRPDLASRPSFSAKTDELPRSFPARSTSFLKVRWLLFFSVPSHSFSRSYFTFFITRIPTQSQEGRLLKHEKQPQLPTSTSEIPKTTSLRTNIQPFGRRRY